MQLNEKPDYEKSQKLEKLRKYLEQVTTFKPRNKQWLARKIVASDNFYKDSDRARKNLVRIIEDERTPLSTKADEVINTEVSYSG